MPNYTQLLERTNIEIEGKNGNIKKLDDEQLYRIYFNGTLNETRLLQETGAHVDDIKAILYRYNKEKRKFKSKELVAAVHQDLLQAFFLESYHERRSASNGGVISTNILAANTPKMKMYRAMGLKEFAAIKAWLESQSIVKGRLTVEDYEINQDVENENAAVSRNIPIKHHLGGLNQANEYLTPSEDHKFLLKFTMSRQTPSLLQNPDTIALQKRQQERSTIGHIATWHRNRGNTLSQAASQNEGHLENRIGLKNENTGGEALSIAVGKNNTSTQALFQTMITRIELVKEVKKK